jgi:hypothetical protein
MNLSLQTIQPNGSVFAQYRYRNQKLALIVLLAIFMALSLMSISPNGKLLALRNRLRARLDALNGRNEKRKKVWDGISPPLSHSCWFFAPPKS